MSRSVRRMCTPIAFFVMAMAVQAAPTVKNRQTVVIPDQSVNSLEVSGTSIVSDQVKSSVASAATQSRSKATIENQAARDNNINLTRKSSVSETHVASENKEFDTKTLSTSSKTLSATVETKAASVDITNNIVMVTAEALQTPVESTTASGIQTTSDPFLITTTEWKPTATGPVTTRAERTTTSVTPQQPKGCKQDFRVNPKNKNQYEILYRNQSLGIFYACPSGLHFNEEKCQCDWPVIELPATCNCCKQGYMKHETNRHYFNRLINGVWVVDSCASSSPSMVWDDVTCKCVWDPNISSGHISGLSAVKVPRINRKCVTLLNMTLDSELKDEDGKHILKSGFISKRSFKQFKGSVNKAMRFVHSPFEVQSFKGNSLEKNVYISFNFRPYLKMRSVEKMTLFSNGCDTDKPSIEISFFPRNGTLQFLFSVKGKSLTTYHKPTPDPYDWYKVKMYLQDKRLTIKVNGETLYHSNGLNGKILKTNCNLKVGGSPFKRDQNYHGLMDEILIVKQCPYAKLQKDQTG